MLQLALDFCHRLVGPSDSLKCVHVTQGRGVWVLASMIKGPSRSESHSIVPTFQYVGL